MKIADSGDTLLCRKGARQQGLPLRHPVRPRRAGLSPSSGPGGPGAPAPRHPLPGHRHAAWFSTEQTCTIFHAHQVSADGQPGERMCGLSPARRTFVPARPRCSTSPTGEEFAAGPPQPGARPSACGLWILAEGSRALARESPHLSEPAAGGTG